MNTLLGCIADDFTGATDLAGLLRRSGVPVRLHLGIPDIDPAGYTSAPFEIIALKCRNSPADSAVAEVLAAWRWLSACGAKRAYWKYCSTFDSTSDGNIGPVADALLDAMQAAGSAEHESANMTLHCPAFPENGRRVFMGNLFVNDQPLHESPMKDHPLTPMHDSDLQRLLGAQTQHSVGKLTYLDVNQENAAVQTRVDELASQGVRHIIGDAVDDMHLVSLVRATEHMRLLCGGSALASHLPAMFRVRGFLSSADETAISPAPAGGHLVLSGSCSEMSRKQVAAWPQDAPSLALDPLVLAADTELVATRARFAEQMQVALSTDRPLLVFATAEPAAVRQAQEQLGADKAGHLVESTLAALALDALASGVRRFVVAGGETSGAVALALGVTQLDVAHEIVPGVPWCRAQAQPVAEAGATQAAAQASQQPIAIALKSGNFGGEHFFEEAFARIDPPQEPARD